MTNNDRRPIDRGGHDLDGTVIIGAGIIGCATAFYLSESQNIKPDTIHLVENSPRLFASASGKSGGFLAADWFGPTTASLGELSFRLHKELAEKYDGRAKWGYSRSTGTSLAEGNGLHNSDGEDWLSSGGSRAQVAATYEFHSDQSGPTWLRRRRGDTVDVIGEDDTVAQVDPLRLSQFLLSESMARGVQLHRPATAVRVTCDEASYIAAVHLQRETGDELVLPCRRLLITAGAWTPSVFRTLFTDSKLHLPISQLAGHSVVVKSPRWTKEHESGGCHAIFTTLRSSFSPEIFSRVGEEIYVCGVNDPSLPLPATATDAQIDRSSIDKLKKVAETLLGRDGTDVSDLEVLREGLCFRPVTRRGTPLLCRIPDKQLGADIKTKPAGQGGVFVAAGHGPWGISQSLGTGKVMAEMLEGEETTADVRYLGL